MQEIGVRLSSGPHLMEMVGRPSMSALSPDITTSAGMLLSEARVWFMRQIACGRFLPSNLLGNTHIHRRPTILDYRGAELPKRGTADLFALAVVVASVPANVANLVN